MTQHKREICLCGERKSRVTFRREKMRVYCDYNATTPLRQEVKAAVIGALDLWPNPSSRSGVGEHLYVSIFNK